MGDEENLAYALELVDSLALPMVLHTAMQLDIFEIMAKNDGSLTAAEVAAKLPTENPQAPAMLERMLRVLASYDVVTSDVEGEGRVYGMTPVARFYVRNEDGVSLRPLMDLLNDRVFIESWAKLKDAVLEGGVPFDKAHGMHAFEYPAIDPRFNQTFNNAMLNHTTLVMKKVLQSYKGFENVTQLIDVGGGLGHTLAIILSHYPNIKGINYDLPHVVENGFPHPGIKYIGGDMFTSVPNGDAIFIKWILHDWDDERCVTLLKNCHKALPDNGKVIVYDCVVSEEVETTAGAKQIGLMDMIMLTQNPGGKERTEKEFITLATASGFKDVTLICKVCNTWIMEFHK
ncbi:Cathecol O-methyltransferase 1-like protein [Drosera capensis]